MTSCSNCYNNCTEIVSDRCIKYTGIDIPILGIKNGDSLSYVEQSLIEFLTSTLDGTGIIPIIDSSIICNLVKNYLPTCRDVNVTDILTALIKATCNLQTQVDNIVADIATIETPYSVGCLTGVISTSGTHSILQAVITKLCIIESNVTALALNVATNYVRISDINTYIAAYLASLNPGGTILYKEKMVPYTVIEYYGSLSNFDTTGAGIGNWDRIFLCNGLNGTPDKRGRVGVGAIQSVPGGTLDPAVNPLTPVTGIFNPNYDLYDKAGLNCNTLTTQEIPAHTHTPSVDVTDPQHDHGIPQDFLVYGSAEGGIQGSPDWKYEINKKTDKASTGITVSVTNASTGGGLPHDNKQPVIACYYIMYIP